MHHSEKPMPGTFSAVMTVISTAVFIFALIIGALAALAQLAGVQLPRV